MNSLSIKLGIILFIVGLSIFGYAEVWGQDWIYIGSTSRGEHFYDVESIAHPSKNIVRVKEKLVYTPSGIREMVRGFGEKYKNLGNKIDLLEINCSDRTYTLLASTHYSKDGQSIESFDFGKAERSFIILGTVEEALYKIVCK